MVRKKQIVKLNCRLCKTEFEVTPYRAKNAKYCSYECSNNRIRTDEELEKISKASKQKFIDNDKLREVSAENGRKAMNYINNNGLAFRMEKGYHTDEYKKMMSNIMSGRKLSKHTKNLIKENHWSNKENSIDIVNKILKKRETNESWNSEERRYILANWALEHPEKVGNGMYNRGYYTSKKTQNIEYYSSGFELEHMKLLDNDDTVLFWTKKHGIRIEYEYNAKKYKYIPDFLVEYKSNDTLILETKGWVRNKEKNDAKIYAAKIYSNTNGYKYKIIYQK
jgi:hypothetical protein